MEAEVLIVGGGMGGLTLGAALAGAGVEVVVLDHGDPAAQRDAAFDGRASAIARGSQQALAGIGLWPRLEDQAEPILDIRVSDGRVGRRASPLFLHYDHREVDGAPLGYIVENCWIRTALHAHAAGLSHLRLLAPCRLESLERGAERVEARLAGGRRITAKLAVSAEGRAASLREAAGIRTTHWTYPQTGIVCTVAHEAPHRGVAHETFLPSGPFAMLPMTDGEDGQGPGHRGSGRRGSGPGSNLALHRSSIVWTERRALAPAMMALDDVAFSAEIARRFGDSLGSLRAIGGRWAYPLSLLLAERAVDHRLALVGDAAHAIHPIAGQGLNMGLRDLAALAEVLVDARRLGLDPGAADVLARYQRWRRLDNLLLVAATDGLNRLFSNDSALLRLVRDLGLAAVQRAPPLKRFFMRHAIGLDGDLPRQARGEAL